MMAEAIIINNLHNYSVDVKDIHIDVGSTFEDFKSFERVLDKRKVYVGEKWVKSRNLKTVTRANKRIDNPNLHYKESFVYAFLNMICYRGGTHISKAQIRKSTTRKSNCPAYIKLKADRSQGKLVVVECMLHHNHDRDLSSDIRYPSKPEWNEGLELECSEVCDNLMVVDDEPVTSTTTTHDIPNTTTPSGPSTSSSSETLVVDIECSRILEIALLKRENEEELDLKSLLCNQKVTDKITSENAQTETSQINKSDDLSTKELLLRLLENKKDQSYNDSNNSNNNNNTKSNSKHYNYALTVGEKLDLLDLRMAFRARREIDDILLKYILGGRIKE